MIEKGKVNNDEIIIFEFYEKTYDETYKYSGLTFN